jgi:hypothetical protein
MANPCSGFKSPRGSGFAFSANISGSEEDLLKLRFSRMRLRIEDLTPLWDGVTEEYRSEIYRTFASEGSYGGYPWAPLALSTQADRARKGFPPAHPILVRTSRLRDSLLESGHPEACGQITPRGWFMGTQVEYAIFHQSRLPRHKIPRRAFLLITTQFRLFVVRAIHRFVVKGETP